MVLLLSLNANAQTQSIIVDTTITADCEFFPFGTVDTIYGLSFTGSVVLNSDSSLVRLVYIDGDNNEWLLMEAYTLITNDTNVVYSKHCDETCYFDGNPTGSIFAEIIDATVTTDSLFYEATIIAQAPLLQQQAKYNMEIEKITSMNKYIEANNLRWIAEYNSVSGLWYFDKKHMLGEKYNYLGFEYYGGGIFETVYTETDMVQTDMVPYFDWRNRHDANVVGTPYFDGDDTNFTGWLTPIKNQLSCGACWAFSTTAAVEAVSNLYYNNTNTNIEPNLSKQQLISCTHNNNCDDGGYAYIAFEYIRDTGIDNEGCFPYQKRDDLLCDDISHCPIPEYVTEIEDYLNVNDSDLEEILTTLITNGPMQVTMATNEGPHGVSLIGYHYNKATSEIFWLIENSWGDWGINGTAWIIRRHNDLVSKAVELPVTINYTDPNDNPERTWDDKDNDGIYWWGIGDMPIGCPGDPTNPDCNDNDPALGGYDDFYNCECIMPYQTQPYVIDKDTYWSGSEQLIDSDIEIEPGYTLTISNVVSLTEGARIIVKRGAKLIVDGGHLTSLCPNKWMGVEVWGTGDVRQEQSMAHGIVELKNGAIIENAKTGIAAIKRSNPIYGLPIAFFLNYSGGIITATNSTIRNCATAVRFWPYPSSTTSLIENSASVFSEVNFEVGEDYIIQEEDDVFKTMAFLDGINGVTFKSVLMNNSQLFNNRLTTNNPDYGIYAINSTFQLEKTIVNNRIENFTYGVFCIASTALNGYTSIRETEFYFNKTGAYVSYPLNYTNIVEILFNEFKTLKGSDYDWSTGLYIDNTAKYIVEENDFFGDRVHNIIGTNYPLVSYGIVVNNCGRGDNWLYNNYIYGCDRGIQAQYSNRSNDGKSGLQIKCNDYDACEYDSYIVGKQPMLDSYGIATHQGKNDPIIPQTTDPAGNTFHYAALPPHNDILNNTHDITYWYHAITNGHSVIPQEYSTNLVQLNANFIDPQPYYKPTSCSTHYVPSGGRDAQSSKTNMLANEIVADSISNELRLLVDAGDTELLYDDVMTSWPDETMELRQELLDASPYLSDSVMMSAAEKAEVLPNAILTEVLVANPQSAKSNIVLETVDERDTLLNQTQYDQVMAGKLIAGAKERIESRLSNANSKREFAMKNLVLAWYDDGLFNATDSIINLLQNEERVQAKYALVDEYLCIFDTISARSTFNAINTDFDLDNEEYDNWLNYEDWIDYRLEQTNSGKGISEPDSLQLIDLYQLHNTTGNQLKAAVRNLLRFADTLSYNEPYLTADTSMKMAKVRARPVGTNTSENELLVYPNPARDYFIIDFSGLTQIDDQLYVEIFSLDGKPFLKLPVSTYSGFKVIDTRMWKPGLYVVSISNDGKLIEAKNVIITR